MIIDKKTRTITSGITLALTDIFTVIRCNSTSAITITIPTASGFPNFNCDVFNVNSGEVTCNGLVIAQNSHAHVSCDGTNWSVVIGGGGSVTETDPVFTSSPAYNISTTDISNWNSAEPNNISDADATDLTDGGETTLHTHANPLTPMTGNITISVGNILTLSGTVTCNGTENVVGSGTSFTSDFSVGDYIWIASPGNYFNKITSITDDNNLIIESNPLAMSPFPNWQFGGGYGTYIAGDDSNPSGPFETIGAAISYMKTFSYVGEYMFTLNLYGGSVDVSDISIVLPDIQLLISGTGTVFNNMEIFGAGMIGIVRCSIDNLTLYGVKVASIMYSYVAYGDGSGINFFNANGTEFDELYLYGVNDSQLYNCQLGYLDIEDGGNHYVGNSSIGSSGIYTYASAVFLYGDTACLGDLDEDEGSKIIVHPLAGSTADRPYKATVGSQYFDTTLNEPLVYDGAAWTTVVGYTHPTQSAITSDNSNGVVIQDISVNTLGHTTSVGTVDLDGRYYTETELNAGQLDNRYYTETEVNNLAGQLNDLLTPKLDKTTFEKLNRFGFLNQTETTIAFDGVNTFTLAPVGSTWSYFRSGKLNTITGSKTRTLSATPPSSKGEYFIYIDDDAGTLSVSNTPWTFDGTFVFVAVITWDNAMTPKYFMSDERHSCLIDRATHKYEHLTNGTQLIVGATISGYVLDSSTDADKTIAISAATIADEDIFLTLADLADGDGTTANYIVAYRSAIGTWSWTYSIMPFKYTTTGYIEYDLNAVMTPITNNQYTNTYILASNVVGNGRFIFVQGRNVYSNLANAKAEDFGSFDLTGFITAEAVALYQLTWQGFVVGGLGKCRLKTVTPITSNIISTTITATVAHEGLSGLQGGTIGEHYHLTAAELANLSSSNADTLNYHDSNYFIAMSIALS